MRKHSIPAVLFGTVVLVYGGVSHAAEVLDLSIHDVQSTTDISGDSPYNGQIHNVTGGIVTQIWFGFKPRIYIQNPSLPQWGGVVVKDWESGELANNVSLGDWVSFSNILIEESRGTTHLQYNKAEDWAPDAAFSVLSTGNALPTPTLLTAADLAVNPVDYLRSEPYESMLVTLEDVIVGELGNGKAGDNYELIQGEDIAWGTDYQNIDAGAPYDPHIVPGASLNSITGIVEQYTKLPDWDYFQLDTRSAADIVPEPGSLFLLVMGILATGRRRRHP